MSAQVPTLSIVFFAVNMLLGIAFPVALFIFFKKKYHCSFIPFLAGVGTFIVFALILESIVHNLVLYSPIGETIMGNIFLYALYGGLAAGIFEETGRFIVMKFMLKKFHGDDHNALMFGAGHGGIEAFSILTITFLNNILYAIMINSGMEQTIFSSVPEGMEFAVEQVKATLEALKTTDPMIYLISPLERIPAVAIHIGLSVIVWFAVTRKGKGWLFPLAILLHAAADGLTVIINSLLGSVLITELFVVIWSASICFLAYKLWKAYRVPQTDTPVIIDNNNDQGDIT